MLVEVATLATVFSIGFRSWHRKGKQHKQQLLARQRQRRNTTKPVIEPKVLSVRKASQQKREVAVSGAGLACSALGFVNPVFSLISLPIVAYSSRENFKVAWRMARRKQVSIETLVSVSLVGAVVMHRLFPAAVLVFLYRISTYLTLKVMDDSQAQLKDYFTQSEGVVWRLDGDAEIETALSDVRVGDLLVVKAGEPIPADGIVETGSGAVDQRVLTGEAVAVEVESGSPVFASTLVLSGRFILRVEEAAEDSRAAKIVQLLNQTADYKAQSTLRMEQFSKDLVNPAVLTSLVALPILGPAASVAVLFAHPKDRLSMIAPVTLLKHLQRSSEQGVIIKDGRSLEMLNEVDTLVLDKTGTLTESASEVGEIMSFGDWDTDKVLGLAAMAEQRQSHPLADAILAAAKVRDLKIPEPEQCELVLGMGLTVQHQGQVVHVGSERFMLTQGLELGERPSQVSQQAAAQGYALVWVACNEEIVGAIEIRPRVREEAKQVIDWLRNHTKVKHIHIVSGDSEAATANLAKQMRIDSWYSETMPEEKAEIIRRLQDEGRFVCFVGDGINDAVALKQAQVSMSMDGATDLAKEAAHIVLMGGGIKQLPAAFSAAKQLNGHINKQCGIVLGFSALGIGGVFLVGMGIGQVLLINMMSLLVTFGYAVLDKASPQRTPKLTNQTDHVIDT